MRDQTDRKIGKGLEVNAIVTTGLEASTEAQIVVMCNSMILHSERGTISPFSKSQKTFCVDEAEVHLQEASLIE